MSTRVSRGVLRAGWQARVADYATTLTWSAVGDAVCVGDAAGGVWVFDSRSGSQRWAEPAAHSGGVMALSQRAGEPILASAGQDGAVVIWDVSAGLQRVRVPVVDAWVEHLAWSPHGHWLAAAAGRCVHVFDSTGALVWSSPEQASTVSALAWAGPSELVATCYGEVSFFSLPSGVCNERLAWRGSLISLALSPDHGIVACGSQDKTVHFWRRATGEDSMMSGYALKPTVLAFDAGGQLLASGGGEDVTVWSFADGGPEGTRPGILEVHTMAVDALAFAHRGRRLASAARDGTVAVWALDTRGNGSADGVGLMDAAVTALAWREDDRGLAAIDADGGVSTWRVS